MSAVHEDDGEGRGRLPLQSPAALHHDEHCTVAGLLLLRSC